MDALIVVWLHFLADFLLQTDKMALNKSKSIKWLSIHCSVYVLPFLWFGWKYALANGLMHWATDFVTSRLTSKAWASGKRKIFFQIIGADQAIHLTCLLLTLKYLIR
jgi:hypothetical protein